MVASDPKIAAKSKILEEVRVDSVIVVGGLGSLHRGRSLSSKEPVLVRAMRSDALTHAREAFAREVLVVRHVEHDGVLVPVEAGVDGNVAVIAYEPVDGSVLTTLLNGTTMPPATVARIVLELGAILDHAHHQPAPLLHGALSSSSVVLAGDEGSVRLLDLGIVQALDRLHVFADAKWELLDPSAAAPELVTRTFPIAPATDVFGLASIAYECLTGEKPFPATNAAAANSMIVAGNRPRVRAERRELHPEVDRLLAMAWSVDPRGRPHDIREFAKMFAAALERKPAPAPALVDISTGPTLPLMQDPVIFEEEDAKTLIVEPRAKSEDPPTVRGPIPDAAKRAHTLPFGLPKSAFRSDPPPAPEKPTTPKPTPVESVDIDFASERPPAPAVHHHAPPPDPEVRTVRVVNVTGLLIALVFAGAVIIAGGFYMGIELVARRAPPVQPLPPAPVIAPAPTPTPTASVAPKPSLEAVALPTPSAPAPSSQWPELAKEPGPRPSPKAMDVMHGKLKAAFEPCLKIPPKPPLGIPWMVHFELDGPTGRPAVVEVSRPFKGTLGGACMLRAALDARVPPFDSPRWSIDLRFGP